MSHKLPAALAVFLVGVTAGVVLFPKPQANGPECTLLLGTGKEPATAFAEAAAATEVRLQLDTREPCHVYVASWSETDGTLALFPTPWLQSEVKQPLPAGTTVLPGGSGGKDLAWFVPPVTGITHWLVVASRSAQPDLESTFDVLRQASNTTFPDGRMVITAPRDHHMGDVPSRSRIADPLLAQAAAQQGAGGRTAMRPVPGREGVWLCSFQLVPPAAK